MSSISLPRIRVSSSLPLSLSPTINPRMQSHHSQDDRADENVVRQSGHANEHNTVAHQAQDEHAEHCADDGAAPARQSRPPNHDHGDHLQFVTRAAVGIGRSRANGADDASETRHDG